jgi:hypothetical protein
VNLDLSILTAIAVLVHLGVGIAGTLLKDNTDRVKLAAIDTKTDQLLATVVQIAPAVPTQAPKNIADVAGDLANVAAALAALSTPAPTAGAVGGTS